MFKFNKLAKLLLSLLLVFSVSSCSFNNDNIDKLFKSSYNNNFPFIRLTNEFNEVDNVIEQNIDGVDSIEKIMEILTSDEFKGRGDDTDGNDKTVEYLNEQFRNIGLDYLFKDTYNHQFNFNSDVFLNFSKPEEIEYNVVGLIKGKNHNERKKAVVISAHFDHIGMGLFDEQELFRGAIDNASGTAALLKIAYELKEMSKEELFDTDIIIAAVNHEELGLIGSRAFVEDIKDRYDSIYNINLDCVGTVTDKPLIIYSSDKRSPELSKAIFDYFDEKNITITKRTKTTDYRSDHLSFEYNGFQAISFSSLSDDVKKIIHTTNDTLDKMDYNKLSNIINYVCEFIKLNDSKTF